MDAIMSALSRGVNDIFGVLKGISVGDILDVIILTFLIYKAIQLVRDTHAGQLLKGVVYLVLCNIVVNLLDMTIMKMVFQVVWSVGLIAIVIVFQPELRHLVERLGRSKIGLFGRTISMEAEERQLRATIEELVKACVAMSESKTGALIVLEQNTVLSDVVDSGTLVDAAISRELLCNVFYPKSPLHDGAAVIRGGRIYAAACILPLTQNHDLDRELGTRHRSAIGLSEGSDALVLVVSEETGVISLANHGQLTRDFDSITLTTKLEELLIGDRFEKRKITKAKKDQGKGGDRRG